MKRHNKMVVQQVTRVYDQEEGERLFEDIEGEEVGTTQVLDDNRFQLTDDQQERAEEDAFDLVLREQRGSGGFTAAELGEESETKRARTSGASATPHKAKKDEEASEHGDSSSDDGLSPAERAQQAEALKQSGAKKGKAKPKSSPQKSQSNTSLSMGNGGGSSGCSDKNVQVLLQEVEVELQTLAKCSTLADIKEETLTSLIARLGSKKKTLGNKVSKDKGTQSVNMIDDINTHKNRLQNIVDLFKAASLFDKKRNRKSAIAIGDKVRAMRSGGVSGEMLPPCLIAYSVFGIVFVFSVDKKWTEALRGCFMCDIKFEIGNAADAAQQNIIQVRAAVLFLCEVVRHLSEENMALTPAIKIMREHCAELTSSHAGGLPGLESMAKTIDSTMDGDSAFEERHKACSSCMCCC